MVKRLLLFVAGTALCVLLAACSLFPDTLTQVTAQRDLSSVITAGTGSDYGVFPVTSGSTSFVILLSRDTTVDPVVVALDGGLNVLGTYTKAQLDGYASSLGMGSYSGSEVLVDADGYVAIGNLLFTAANLQAATSPTAATTVGTYNPCFASATYAQVFANCGTDSANTFSCYAYTETAGTWAYASYLSASISSDTSTSWYMRGIFNVDDASSAGAVVIALGSNDSSTVTFVRVGLSDFNSLALSSPLLSYYTKATVDSLESDSISFAGDCIVAYNYNSRALVRYSATDFSVLGSFSLGRQNNDVQWVFSADGSFGIEFDRDHRIVSRVAKWW